MATYRDQGIVLRTHKLGETDRILTLMTQGRGKVRAVAKGVRRPGSRFGGRLEPYSHVDLLLYEGRSLDVVTQADLLASHGNVRLDWETSAAAAVLVELVDAVAIEGDRDNRLFLQLRAGLQALDAQPPDTRAFIDAFLLRVAGAVGFRVDTTRCATCGTMGPHPFLSVVHGGTLCADCAPGGTRAVAPDVVARLEVLASDGWAPLVALPDDEAGRVAASFARAYAEHHLDRRLKSYPLSPREAIA